MLNVLTLSLLAAMAAMTTSFTQFSPHANKFLRTIQLGTTSSNDNISSPTKDAEKSPLNPSSAFGQPIPPKISTFNKLAISFVKNNVFDSFFDATSKSTSRAESLTRSYARFYALETIARMPYFSYLSVLHLYETLGLWRRADYMKVHFCESWNEMHHLLIMEELGGNKRYIDRFVAQHCAFFLLLVCGHLLYV